MKGNFTLEKEDLKDEFILVSLLGDYLNLTPAEEVVGGVKRLMKFGLTDEEAMRILIAESTGLNTEIHRDFFMRYFPLCVKKLDPTPFLDDEYYKNVKFKRERMGKAMICREKYAAYEPFVFDDMYRSFDGMLIPKTGFFSEEFSYPAIKENGRIWMTVTPNEINTMRAPIENAEGVVVALGLGLGYYAYMTGIKKDVKKVYVVEKSDEIISLYENFLKPQFSCADKIEIIKGDAYEICERGLLPKADVVFCDLWHDVSDGVDGYKRLKKCEGLYPSAKFYYWIEKSIRFYL